jgi:protein dithiol oxidoreductase (disulfide-forming)
MKRREFSAQLLGTGLGVGLAGAGIAAAPAAQAQSASPVEGKDYVRLSQPQVLPPGKIEVVDFFWYGCPHCFAFEPSLDAWAKKLPADISFRRVPVSFRDEPFGTHARIFYALEATGQVDAMHRKVFYAIHNERATLAKPAEVSAFMTKNGVDGAKFLEVMSSFSVQTKARQAKQVTDVYKIDGVPALGIHGRYYTSGSVAGSNDRALAVADFLIERTRKG